MSRTTQKRKKLGVARLELAVSRSHSAFNTYNGEYVQDSLTILRTPK